MDVFLVAMLGARTKIYLMYIGGLIMENSRVDRRYFTFVLTGVAVLVSVN